MENLYNQIRVRFPGVGQEKKEETSSNRDQRIPPQKTQSFKGEKKKRKNWFGRQLSWKMNSEYDFAEGHEYPTAVAAATFAIKSLEESRIPSPNKINDVRGSSSAKITSKAEDRTTHAPEPRTVSRKFSDKKPEMILDPAPFIKRTPTALDNKLNNTGSTKFEKGMPQSTVDSDPFIKKTPTFPDGNPKRTDSTKPESAMPKPDLPPTKQPTSKPAEINNQKSTKPGIHDAKADGWEKAQMAKINERHEKLNATILNWESKKKAKARRKMEKKQLQAKSEKKKAKALLHYRSKVETIDQIAGGARAQAEENRRNEEFKVKDKGNKIRATGELPAKCFCF